MLDELMCVLKHRWLESNLRLDYLILIVLYSKINKKTLNLFLGSYVVWNQTLIWSNVTSVWTVMWSYWSHQCGSPLCACRCLCWASQQQTGGSQFSGGISKFQTLILIKHLCATTITNIICQLHIFYQICFHENGAATELLTWSIKLFPL